MKTRVFNMSQVCLTLILCLGLTACNKDEFYEKEYLDNPYRDETTTDGGSQGGDAAGTDGSTQGGVAGGVDGGTDGGSTTGSSTGGSTVGGAATGGTDGGTTGSTTGGTDGGTTGSTTGGTDGGTTGSTAGGTNGGTTGGQVYQDMEENFKQSSEQTKKLDIVWIIDNSGSMADEQADLGTNFSAFIDDFVDQNVDFKMAITTTDTSSDAKKGRMVTGSAEKLNSAAAAADENQFKEDFKNLVKVGTSGSGYEKGLAASEAFVNKTENQGFLRDDAYLVVVVLSDEEDQSALTPTQYADILKAKKAEAGLVKVYSIVDTGLTNCCQNGISTGFQRYADVSNLTNGAVGNIRDNFHTVLRDMGASIINLLDSFALAHTPVNGTLKVFVDGVESTDFTYDSGSNSVKFNAGSIPAAGAQVKVTYKK